MIWLQVSQQNHLPESRQKICRAWFSESRKCLLGSAFSWLLHNLTLTAPVFPRECIFCYSSEHNANLTMYFLLLQFPILFVHLCILQKQSMSYCTYNLKATKVHDLRNIPPVVFWQQDTPAIQAVLQHKGTASFCAMAQLITFKGKLLMPTAKINTQEK